MSLALTTDILLQAVGKRVKNNQGIHLGEIIEITRNTSDTTIEYAILKSDENKRHFAIPVSSRLMNITETGEMIIHLDKRELELSTSIQYAKCPSPNFQAKPSVFELIEYNEPQISNEKKNNVQNLECPKR